MVAASDNTASPVIRSPVSVPTRAAISRNSSPTASGLAARAASSPARARVSSPMVASPGPNVRLVVDYPPPYHYLEVLGLLDGRLQHPVAEHLEAVAEQPDVPAQRGVGRVHRGPVQDDVAPAVHLADDQVVWAHL